MGSRAGPADASERGREWAWILPVLLLAFLPSVGTVSAPWIADDAGILARVERSGPWKDWTRSQYGLELVRFWRPVVSTTWALQERWTGIEPVPLRLFNLVAHAFGALLAGALVRRLGARRAGAFLAGAFAALHPEQGGTVTWLAGRTDLLVGLALLGSTAVALGRRPLLSAPLAFLACATKEFGLLAPLWVALLAFGRGERPRAALLRALPAGAGVVLASLARRAALGTWIGGYEAAPEVALAAGLGPGVGAVLSTAWPTLLVLAALALTGWRAGTARGRPLGMALACASCALVPLYPLLSRGLLEAQNARLLHVAELGCALAAGFALAETPRRAAWPVLALLALASASALSVRGVLAWRDTHEWARAAEVGERRIAVARAAVAATPDDAGPALFDTFPPSWEGAYCLGFGLPDRFRPPFEVPAVPIWPLRTLFGSASRAPLVTPRAEERFAGSSWPRSDPRAGAPLGVAGAGGGVLGALALDEDCFASAIDRSPRLELCADAPGARLEVLVYTDSGYEPFPCGRLDAQGGARTSSMLLMAASNGTATLGQALAQAADLGATQAYLEFRALSEEGGVLAASGWLEVTWPASLLRKSLGRSP